jgi:hypothetical protein
MTVCVDATRNQTSVTASKTKNACRSELKNLRSDERDSDAFAYSSKGNERDDIDEG